MKIVRVKKQGKDSLYTTFLTMTLIPLLVFGIIAISFISYRVRESTKKQIETSLRDMAVTVENAYDIMYPGDYSVLAMKKSTTLYKGDNSISGNTALIDRVKSESDMDVSFFFADMRLATTLVNEEGNRYTEVSAAETVVNDVYLAGKEKFYDNVKIGNTPYYAYYMPIYQTDGSCFGMIGVAVPSRRVNSEVTKSIYQTIAILIIFMLITAYYVMQSSSKMMVIITKILEFLKSLTNDKLDAKLDDIVIGRKDELGEIGLASTKLQSSLKKLIERDALTGLYNRRAGERKLDVLEEEGIKSSISIGDIDFFKKFNDTFGHECGDVVLKEVAACLREGMKGKGFVARWGGEEFLLVFESMEEKEAAAELEKILQSIRDRVIEYDGQIHSVTMTFGIVGRNDDEKISGQIRRADDKLYEGKQGGRNRVIC